MQLSFNTQYIDNIGSLFIFGSNIYGHQNNNTDTYATTNINIPVISEKVLKVSSTHAHTQIIGENNLLYVYGRNINNECNSVLSDYYYFDYELPVTNQNVKEISCGMSHTQFITSAGQLYVYGDNYNYQCDPSMQQTHNYYNLNTPVTNTLVKYVSCGQYHTQFITEENYLYVYGGNGNRQCDPNLNNIYQKNIQYPIQSNVREISCGQYHTQFITQDDKLYIYGNNLKNQCNSQITNTYTNITTPFQENIRHVSCGNYFTQFIDNSNDLYTFGDNTYKQSNPTSQITSISTPFFINSNVNNVQTGQDHIFYINNSGQLYVFGRNSQYQSNPTIYLNDLLAQNPITTYSTPLGDQVNITKLNDNRELQSIPQKCTTPSISSVVISNITNNQFNFSCSLFNTIKFELYITNNSLDEYELMYTDNISGSQSLNIVIDSLEQYTQYKCMVKLYNSVNSYSDSLFTYYYTYQITTFKDNCIMPTFSNLSINNIQYNTQTINFNIINQYDVLIYISDDDGDTYTLYDSFVVDKTVYNISLSSLPVLPDTNYKIRLQQNNIGSWCRTVNIEDNSLEFTSPKYPCDTIVITGFSSTSGSITQTSIGINFIVENECQYLLEYRKIGEEEWLYVLNTYTTGSISTIVNSLDCNTQYQFKLSQEKIGELCDTTYFTSNILVVNTQDCNYLDDLKSQLQLYCRFGNFPGTEVQINDNISFLGEDSTPTEYPQNFPINAFNNQEISTSMERYIRIKPYYLNNTTNIGNIKIYTTLDNENCFIYYKNSTTYNTPLKFNTLQSLQLIGYDILHNNIEEQANITIGDSTENTIDTIQTYTDYIRLVLVILNNQVDLEEIQFFISYDEII